MTVGSREVSKCDSILISFCCSISCVTESKQRLQGVNTALFIKLIILSRIQLQRDGKSTAVNKTATNQRDSIHKSASSLHNQKPFGQKSLRFGLLAYSKMDSSLSFIVCSISIYGFAQSLHVQAHDSRQRSDKFALGFSEKDLQIFICWLIGRKFVKNLWV